MGEEGGKEGRREVTLIKPRDPHLAGGEKEQNLASGNQTWLDGNFPHFVRCFFSSCKLLFSHMLLCY